MAIANDSQAKGIVSRGLPQAQPDTNSIYDRSDRYGGKFVSSVVPTKHLLADEGGYFVATNNQLTPTTPNSFDSLTTFALQTTFSSTAAAFVVRNNEIVGGKNIYLDYLRLIAGAVAATATSFRIGVLLDSATRSPGPGSGASAIPSNTNTVSAVASISSVLSFTGGTLTVGGAVASRNVGQTSLKQSIPITGDEFVCHFGSVDPPAGQAGTSAAITIAGKYASALPPVVVGPQSAAIIYLWQPGAATTAPTFTWEIGMWER